MTLLDLPIEARRAAILSAVVRTSGVRLVAGTEVFAIDVSDARGRVLFARLGRSPAHVATYGLRRVVLLVVGPGEIAALAAPWWPAHVARNPLTSGEVRLGIFALGGLELAVRVTADPVDDRAELEAIGVSLLGVAEIARGSALVEARVIARAKSEALAELLVVRAIVSTRKDGRAHDQQQARCAVVLKLPGGAATYLSLRTPLVPALIEGLRRFLEIGDAEKLEAKPASDREAQP